MSLFDRPVIIDWYINNNLELKHVLKKFSAKLYMVIQFTATKHDIKHNI